jgi:HEAT repeat
MRKWLRNVLLAGMTITLLGVVAWPALRGSPDPVYEGKRLSEWLQRYDSPGEDAYAHQIDQPDTDAAVRQIGTNATPRLLAMVRAKDTDLIPKLVSLARRQHLMEVHYVPADRRNYEAARAFAVLGADASNAVPELIKAYDPGGSTSSQNAIVSSLGGIGPAAKDAVPLLLQVLATNTNDIVWRGCFGALGEIHSEPEMVVPVLTGLMHNPKADACYFAAQTLGCFGMDAKPATSDLLELLQDQDSNVREIAFRTLRQIYKSDNEDRYTKWWWNRKLPGVYTPSELVGVINYFGAMGPNAAPAVPALVKFLSDPDEDVRISATNALKAIDPKAAAKAGGR